MKLKSCNIEKYNKCLELYAKGLTQKDISKTINISDKTVSKWLKPNKTYIENLEQAKANIINRINLALKK